MQSTIDFPLRRLRSKNKENKEERSRTASLPPTAVSRILKTPTKRAQTPTRRGGVAKATATPTPAPFKALNSPRKTPRKVLAEVTTDQVDAVSPRRTLFLTQSAPVTPVKSAKKKLFKRDTTRYMEAKQALSTAVPEELVGRIAQMSVMTTFLNNALVKKTKKSSIKQSLYISGAPGTGKTACLKHLLRAMETKDFREIFVNCMSLKSSKDIYAKIASEIDAKYEAGNAMKFVEERICNGKSGNILLVLDEIDQLDSKAQEILYSIFEWPHLPGSRLVLVGIANALDLTDRILPRLMLSAAISPTQLSFPAYTREEINCIITSRLKEAAAKGSSNENNSEPIIKPLAVKFLAGKISSLSGDIRKALDVCRRAIELAEIEYRKQSILAPLTDDGGSTTVKQIDLPQILRIFNEVYSSRVTASLKSGSGSDLPSQQKILLATLLLMTNYASKKCKEVSLGKLHETYSRICKKRILVSLDLSEAASLCSLLEARGLFSVKKSKNARDMKICLRIDEAEVEAALQDKTLLSNIVSDVSCIAK